MTSQLVNRFIDLDLATIGCLLDCCPEALDNTLAHLPKSAFEREDCRQAYEIISERHQAGLPTDPPLLWNAWQDRFGGPPPVDILTSLTALESAHALPDYIGGLIERMQRRELRKAGLKLSHDAGDPMLDLDEIRANLDRALTPGRYDQIPVLTAKEATLTLHSDLERRIALQGRLTGIATGLNRLDKKLDGLQYGEQTILAARPSHGKTALALNILSEATIMKGIPALFVSLEMGVSALMRRMLAARYSIPMPDLRTGQLNERQLNLSGIFGIAVAKSPVFFVNAVGGINITRLVGIARSYWRQHGIKFICIDYIQKIKAAVALEKRTYEIGAVSEALKGLAEETGAALLTLAQLNREPEKDKGRAPRLSDLADSAQIERDADTVLLLNRNRDNEDAWVYIAKQRDGDLDTIPLRFEGQFCRFTSRYE